MKQINILFAIILLLASTNIAAALLSSESAEIPYQINHSNRIIIGTVTDIQPFYDYTIVTIGVDEWLMNPLSTETITVRTKIGMNFWTEDEPTFALNETIILMLEDVNIDDDIFGVVFGVAGKHPLSDRDAVLQELDAREQAQIEDDSNMGGKTVDEIPDDEVPVNGAPVNRIPFMGATGTLMILIGEVLLAHYRKYGFRRYTKGRTSMNKNKSMLIGISLGTLIVILGTYSNYTDESTLLLSAIIVGIVIGYSIESKPLKLTALAVIIQQIIGNGIVLFNDPNLDVVLSYGVIAGFFVVGVIINILFNVLFGILGSFIGSIARKYRK